MRECPKIICIDWSEAIILWRDKCVIINNDCTFIIGIIYN